MKKIVCDICRKNEASEKFKVKKEKITNYELFTRDYVRIDICESCYRKLLNASNENSGQ